MKVLSDKIGSKCGNRSKLRITAGFLYRAGAETPLYFREKFRISPRTILKHFSAVGTQTGVLVSAAEVWIGYPNTYFSFFLGMHT